MSTTNVKATEERAEQALELSPPVKIEAPQPDWQALPRLVTYDYTEVMAGDVLVVERRIQVPYALRRHTIFWLPATVTRVTKTRVHLDPDDKGATLVLTRGGKIVGGDPYDRVRRLTGEGLRSFDHEASGQAYEKIVQLRARIRGILRTGVFGDSVMSSGALTALRTAANEGLVDEALMAAAEQLVNVLKPRARGW